MLYYAILVSMYVATVPNRNSPPAILLRESFRDGGKVKTRTLANITHLHAGQVAALRLALAGNLPTAGSPLSNSLSDAFLITRSRPHGHVAAVLGSLRNLQLDAILDPLPSRPRDLVIAMIVARILDPGSKLATARGLHSDTLHSSLGELLHLDAADETELYQAMDWLLPRQAAIEQELAKRQLSDGAMVLYDLTSTYFEGRHCPLAKLGHSRDDKSGKPQIVFGLLTSAQGCPVAVEVFAGNTADPNTVATQVNKLRQRFGLQRVVLVGDRGMITSARIREDFGTKATAAPTGAQGDAAASPAVNSHGLEWISALRAAQIQKLARDGQLQMSLFDKTDLVEIAHPEFPGERLIACFNPLLAEERARKRPELLAATEKQLDKIVAATQRVKRPFRGKDKIGLRAGKILNRYKMGKHFELEIKEDSFQYKRKTANIEREQSLDGIYVIRTSVQVEVLSSQQVVASYKSLSGVERAFRSLKTVDLQVRPIHHRLSERVRAHILLCMLAYYVEWHMRQKLAPMLFDDHDKPQAQAARASIVAPAKRSPAALRKAATKTTDDGLKAHSFQSLLGDLATIVKNRIQSKDKKLPAFDMLTTPTVIQQKALDLLAVNLQLN
jgi:transposase